MLELDKIYNEDCLEGMKRIPDGSVDCCITDPPYKLEAGGCAGGLNIVFNQASKKDVQSGELFEIPPFDAWMKEVYRALKNGSHFYCMTNDKNLKDIIIAAEYVGFKEVNILVWAKGMHTPLPYYMKNIEFVVLFRKGSSRKINNMGDFALIDGIKGVYGDKIHPSEKPVPLFQKFIENSTNEGDIVLEPFIGSGTLARACHRTNRHFIGFELSKEYFDMACERIKIEKQQLTLDIK